MCDMDRAARGWLYNTAKKNHWRVKGLMDFEDLIQEGNYCWARVCARYVHLSSLMKTHERHRRRLMALFQTTFTNHIHFLAKKLEFEAPLPDGASYPDGPCELSELLLLVSEAPPPIRALLRRAIAGDTACLRSLPRRRPDGTRATMNDRLCALANVPPGSRDLSRELREYLSSV